MRRNASEPGCPGRLKGSILRQHNSLVVLSAIATLLTPERLSACEPGPFGAVRASSAILFEVGSAQELVSHEPTTPIAPASLVKLMTVYLTFEAVKAGQVQLKDEVVVSEAAWRMGGSQMFLEPGDRVPLRELLRGMAIIGANDAAVAVAEHLAIGLASLAHRSCSFSNAGTLIPPLNLSRESVGA